MANNNLLAPVSSKISFYHPETYTYNPTYADDYSCSCTFTNASAYAQFEFYPSSVNLASRDVLLQFATIGASSNTAVLKLYIYSDSSNYVLYDYEQGDGQLPNNTKILFSVPATYYRIRIRIALKSNTTVSDQNPVTVSFTGAHMAIADGASGITLNFHKVLAQNLPETVTAGTQHVYFVSDGASVSQYIADNDGHIVPVKAAYIPSESANYANVYTQDWIDERKQDVLDLLKLGHCFVFAVATDIHVRIEDGDEGRYNQVRDYILLSEQIPLDAVVCHGDIMSYAQEYGGVWEPRIEKVKDIFNLMRCPWWATRGNHDYNEDDNSWQSNNNIVHVTTENVDDIFVTNNVWYRSMNAQFPTFDQYKTVYDTYDGRHQYGYFYVDDFAHKHRYIFTNSEETQETPLGNPYIDDNDEIDAVISGISTKHQIEWLAYKALDFSDKTDRSEWTVSFHSHTVPFTDAGESAVGTVDDIRNSDGFREFHGYGWNDPDIRALVHAFQFGESFARRFSCQNTDTATWMHLDIAKDYSAQGPIDVIGWFGGHCHDDCYYKINDLNIDISTCTCADWRRRWSNDDAISVTLDAGGTTVTIEGETYTVTDNKFTYRHQQYTLVNGACTVYKGKLPPERNSTDLAMSVNVFVVNKDTKTVNMVKFGSKKDNTSKTSSDFQFSYARPAQ